MPHLSQLQEKHAADGLTVIGITRPDANNTLEQVRAMVAEKAAVMRYSIAWDADGGSYANWMTAAGMRGIPACFVVDGGGRIAWIGHPNSLDLVLPRVIGGRWNAATSPAEAEKLLTEFSRLSREAAARLQGDAAARLLELFADFGKRCPELAPRLDEPRYHLLVGAGRLDEAHVLGLRLVAEWKAAGDATALNELAWSIADPEAAPAARDLPLALFAATTAAQLNRWQDPYSLDTLAAVHWQLGDRARAIAVQKEAIAAAAAGATAGLRAQLNQRLTEYQTAR